MNNLIYLIGRLTTKPEKTEKGAIIKVAVQRSFMDAEGIYETDFFSVTLLGGIADNAIKYCEKSDLVGIKGRMQDNEGTIELIAEKVSFLSSTKPKDESKIIVD